MAINHQFGSTINQIVVGIEFQSLWSAGLVFVNPPINTVILDTGPFVTTDKQRVTISATHTALAPQRIRFERRNSLNTATLQSFELWVPVNVTLWWSSVSGIIVLKNERFRLVTLTAPGVGASIQGSLIRAILVS